MVCGRDVVIVAMLVTCRRDKRSLMLSRSYWLRCFHHVVVIAVGRSILVLFIVAFSSLMVLSSNYVLKQCVYFSDLVSTSKNNTKTPSPPRSRCCKHKRPAAHIPPWPSARTGASLPSPSAATSASSCSMTCRPTKRRG